MEYLKAKEDNKIIDYIGLYLVGILSLGYVVSGILFAKLHFRLSFLNAPLFIGDIVFVICLSLFFLKWIRNNNGIGISSCLFLFYSYFVIVKIFLGYFYWGPLSLRHSVLFLYPLFAVFCYSFYRSDFFKPKKVLSLILILFLVFKFLNFYSYFALTVFVVTVILINSYSKWPGRCILYLLLLAVFPYGLIFHSSRTFITSNFVALIFMGLGSLSILKIKKTYKFILCLVLIFILPFVIIKNNNANELKSIFGFKELRNKYNETMELLYIKEPAFVAEEFEISLYNDHRGQFKGFRATSDEFKSKEHKSVLDVVLSKETNKANYSAASVKKAAKVAVPVSDSGTGRSIETPYNNTLFRIFIWREALRQLIIKHPLFGFDFGKPFRCREIEILGWAQGEWRNDGWVCMHNSYIDIVYRAGIIGVLMVVSILTMLFFLVRSSLRRHSLNGILLSGVILNWFMAANFLEILEMPYSAIPLWSLFGVTCAYLFKNKKL